MRNWAVDKWYKLDHAGKLFPAVTNNKNTSTFRVSMIMNRPVNPPILQQALDTVMERFPMMAVKLNYGVFWRFLSGNENRLLVREETNYPCAPITVTENNGFLLRVLYYKQKISVEIFHALTDGTGAVEFLKTLVFQYLNLTGENVNDDEGLILLPETFSSRSEAKDSYDSYYTSNHKAVKQKQKAYHIQGSRFVPYGHNVIHGLLSASELQGIARENGVTITAYLTALLIAAIHTSMLPDEYHKPIMITIPVNLRKIFISKSLRNFFTVVNIGMKVTEDIAFADILTEVSNQLKERTSKNYLEKTITESMKFEKNLASRLVPIGLKELAIRYGFDHLGENLKTMTLTNIGNIKLPKSMTHHIDAVEATIYPTNKSPINCAVSSVNNQLVITFARNIVESEIIREFFHLLSSQSGLEVQIVSNNWGIRL